MNINLRVIKSKLCFCFDKSRRLTLSGNGSLFKNCVDMVAACILSWRCSKWSCLSC